MFPQTGELRAAFLSVACNAGGRQDRWEEAVGGGVDRLPPSENPLLITRAFPASPALAPHLPLTTMTAWEMEEDGGQGRSRPRCSHLARTPRRDTRYAFYHPFLFCKRGRTFFKICSSWAMNAGVNFTKL